MPQRTADSTLDELIDKNSASGACGLCLFITSIAGLVWTLIR